VTQLALLAQGGPSLWTFFGRFHPATVHFPIALLSVTALLETLQVLRRKPALSPATLPLAAIGAVSAVLAALMGWANASGRKAQDALDAHRWAGIATAALALVAWLLVERARHAEGTRVRLARGSLFLATILAGLAGHWGGVLVYGNEYYVSGWPWGKKETEVPEMPASSWVDFREDIAPILRKSCFSCHGGDKSGKNGKGGLRLSTKALAMKGGDAGSCIAPGDPAKSSLYTLLLEEDPDKRMPEKAKPLPRAEIQKIRKWILEGAEWPDGFELKE
jgi:uncharacterized membrane protein